MIARNLSQALVFLMLIGMPPVRAAAEQAPSGPPAAEAAEVAEATEIADENKPTADSAVASSNSQTEPGEPDQTSQDSPFGDQPDPLFDDDFDLETSSSYPDPLEESNRAIFAFNQGVDFILIGPITKFFGWVTPTVVKRGLRNFFDNLNYPVVVANDMLQLEWKDAAVCTGAFVVNSTVGIGGLFEPAKHIGLPRHESDFGQTLALARVPSGPYLIIPIAGPSTARGTVGSVVDFFMRPNTWLLPLSNFYYYGGEGVVTLEENQDGLEELERSSVDFYSVLHSAYYQIRDDEIWGRRQDRRPTDPETD